MDPKKRFSARLKLFLLGLLSFIVILYFTFEILLGAIGNFLVHDDTPVHADAVVVLNTGVEYFSRLIEAGTLYNKGYADTIVINGNRKMDSQRELEAKGYVPCCPWYENIYRVLALYHIPRRNIIHISAEDVYDSVGEAEIVGNHLKRLGIRKIIITTSKFHTKRARFIWNNFFHDDFVIQSVSAKTDPYDPNGWWRDGRQIRWVLAEYGAWIYYYWKKLKG